MLVATVLAPLLAGAPLPADPSTTRIVAPVAGAVRLDDRSRPAAARPLLVRGRSDGRAGGTIDVVCVAGPRTAVLRRAVPLRAGGRIRTAIALSRVPVGGCDLRAVPAGLREATGEQFRGPRLVVVRYEPARPVPAAGDEGGGSDRFRVAGDGVVVREAERGIDVAGGWRGAARIAAVRVDGRPALLPGAVPRLRGRAPRGFAGVDAHAEVAPRSGRVTVTTVSPLARCDGDAALGGCGRLAEAGVRLERTVTVTGATADVRDRWVATDQRPHRVEVSVVHPATMLVAPTWWQPHGGDPGPLPGILPARAGTVVAVGASGAAGLGVAPVPTRLTGRGPATIVDETSIDVPATGGAALHRVLAVAVDRERAASAARVVVDPASAPRIAIDAPADGTVSRASSITVRGRADDPDGVAQVRVAGRVARLGRDGRFAVRVPLHDGANPIAAVATDRRGDTGAAQVSVGRIFVGGRPDPERPGGSA
ncbi:putativeglycinee rich protein [Patulibacter medicamentivorans]|uniref:Putativeglycinee rich protein n=1 Tax=Patulibacter medicamentivorans TaxID=1097667 RepID=H0EAC7_9ACTN|nr:Ig-like domain-containing protein [Patulibacter medicamentivorans]EHN09381.1 putativeglycinee rich protein [Patulibacter medicamentivorans]